MLGKLRPTVIEKLQPCDLSTRSYIHRIILTKWQNYICCRPNSVPPLNTLAKQKRTYSPCNSFPFVENLPGSIHWVVTSPLNLIGLDNLQNQEGADNKFNEQKQKNNAALWTFWTLLLVTEPDSPCNLKWRCSVKITLPPYRLSHEKLNSMLPSKLSLPLPSELVSLHIK